MSVESPVNPRETGDIQGFNTEESDDLKNKVSYGFCNFAGASMNYVPDTGYAKGMKSGISGIVTGLSTLSTGTFIFVLPSLVIDSRKKEMLLSAMLCCVTTNALFGITFYAHPGIYEVLCIAIQFINGIANAVIGSLCVSIACTAFPAYPGRVTGLINFMNGASLVAPTLIATVFYDIGGFVASFLWIAGFQPRAYYISKKEGGIQRFNTADSNELEGGKSVAPIQQSLWFRLIGVSLIAISYGFCNFSGASMIYVPDTGYAKGMKSGVSGIVTGLSTLSTGVFIFVLPSLVINSMKKEMITSAMACCVITNILFAITFYAHPGIYEVLCIAIQFINGIANAVIGSLCVSIACTAFPAYPGRVTGFINFMNGVSLVAPTLIATVFYDIGGFVASFLWIAGFQFCVLVGSIIFARDYRKHEVDQSKGGIDFGALAKFIIQPHTLSLSTCIFMSGTLYGFAANTLGPHLRNRYNIHNNLVNIYMSGYTLFMLFTTPVAIIFVEYGYGGFVTLVGGIMSILVNIAWILPSIVSFLDNQYVILLGLVLMGVQNGMVQLTMYLMYEKLAEEKQAFPMDQVKLVTAALDIGIYDIGYFAGTFVFGGFIYQYGKFELPVTLLLACAVIILLPLLYTLYKQGFLRKTFYYSEH